MLGALLAEVAIGRAPVFGDRARARLLEELEPGRALAQEGEVGVDRRDIFAVFDCEAEDPGVEGHGGLDVGDRETDMVVLEVGEKIRHRRQP